MSTGNFKRLVASVLAVVFMLATPVLCQEAAVQAGTTGDVAVEAAAAPAPEAAPPVEAAATSGDDTATAAATAGVSEAEEYYRRGVALYKRDLYREALTEFNRALAMDPNLQDAQTFKEKCNQKLQIMAVGAEPSAPPAVDVLDSTAVSPGETPQSAKEIRKERVKTLLRDAKRYLEAGQNATAVEIYNNVLLIEPKNTEAREGLHQATLGANKDSIADSSKAVDENYGAIEQMIWEKKEFPKGAGPDGIKPYRFTVPEIEEKVVKKTEQTEIEKTLASPVSIEFEDIHINEVVEFIADSWNINFVIDHRAVQPPESALNKAQSAAAAPPAPGAPGAPGAFPAPAGAGAGRPGGPGAAGPGGRPPMGGAVPAGGGRVSGVPGAGNTIEAKSASDPFYGVKSDGIVPYINLKDVTLAEALTALLRPLGLDYSIQAGYIWISRPDIIRQETFEELETRFYELRNVLSDRLFKLVLRNPFGGVAGGGMGGGSYGGRGGMGGMSGGMMGGGMSGGMMGGGMRGGMSGGMGGMSGGMMGGGMMGGGMSGGMMGGGMGGMSGGMGGMSGGMMGGGMSGMGGMRGGMGGMSGGMMGGGGGGADVTAISNISLMFSTISDAMVGELGTLSFQTAGTGNRSRAGGGGGAGYAGAQGAAGLGGATAQGLEQEGSMLKIIASFLPEIREPYSDEVLSSIDFNEASNMLIVKNTPKNLDNFEKMLGQIDVTPKQVSIEAKFLTISITDMEKIGFTWDATLSDQNNRAREIESLAEDTYSYDVNGDGVDESIPFYQRPDGSNVIRNTITDGVITAATSPGGSGATPTFRLVSKILDNADGDTLGLTFDYLDSLDQSELLSAPRVTTMNRKPAVVADFQTEYFQSQVLRQAYPISVGGTINGNVQMAVMEQPIYTPFNFGIALSVTPQVRDNDQVRLWLNPEVRTRLGEKKFETKQITGDQESVSTVTLPTTSWQAVWTNVIVHDGDTLVLGGLVQDRTVKSKQKMPYLADIPVLGFFFQGNSKDVKQSSLLIFVTPDIVDSTGARFFDVGEES